MKTSDEHKFSESHHVDEFLARHRLPDAFRTLIDEHYFPLADWIAGRKDDGRPLLLGINGAQGTGKSTLADLLKLVLEVTGNRWNVAVISIDDFYLTRAERKELAMHIHPLLETRGVPGTHDTRMLVDCLHALQDLAPGETCRLPRFDKSADDRAPENEWPQITGPVDLIILEGWCVGSTAQAAGELRRPVNKLERDEDPSCAWRQFVNDELASAYQPVFELLDALVFIKAPDFDCVYRWRLEQEEKLAAHSADDAVGVMTSQEVARFIQFYERLTRHNLSVLTEQADVVLELDTNHQCVASRYR